jgi:hypothetical protein
MKIKFFIFIASAVFLPVVQFVLAQTDQAIDPDALIDHIISVEAQQREAISDISFDVEMIEWEGDGNEKSRFVKKTYFKVNSDTTLMAEEYLEYYKEGELQSEDEMQKQVKERREKAQKRKANNVSFRAITPFLKSHRDAYKIDYVGLSRDQIEGHTCHHFHVEPLEASDTLISGDYYFDSESFNLARTEFSPSKLVKKLMFKLKELKITINYAPVGDNYWLPSRVDVVGKGKAAIFIGVNFATTEYYRNPVINQGVPEEAFEEIAEDEDDE